MFKYAATITLAFGAIPHVLLMHLIHTSQAPSYLTDIVTQTASGPAAVSATSNHVHDYCSDNERFSTLHQLRGTVCHRHFKNYLTLSHSNET